MALTWCPNNQPSYTYVYSFISCLQITSWTLPTFDPHADEKRISLRDFTSQTGNIVSKFINFNFQMTDFVLFIGIIASVIILLFIIYKHTSYIDLRLETNR